MGNPLLNKRFRNGLQLSSIAIITCTLFVFHVNYTIRENSEELARSLYYEELEKLGASSERNDTGGGGSLNNTSDVSFVTDGNEVGVVGSESKTGEEKVEETGGSSQKSEGRFARDSSAILKKYDPRVNYVHGATYSDMSVDSVFFSVKSTKRFHQTRLKPVLQTWFNLAKDQTWIFTDDDDPELDTLTNGHIINTHCPATHYRQALCCKMSMEFDAFLRTSKSWFCHFDDDNYVNVPALLDLLAEYNPEEDWYLGKPSLKKPIKIPNPNNRSEEASFWFATGGAGFCLSRSLALRMSPEASGGKFIKVCDRIQLPDDVTIGYIVGHLLNTNLTVIPKFHSHFETMKFLDMKTASSEITFSYVRYDNYENILDVKGFSEEKDPTRFLSLHCLLYPNFSYCPDNR